MSMSGIIIVHYLPWLPLSLASTVEVEAAAGCCSVSAIACVYIFANRIEKWENLEENKEE